MGDAETAIAEAKRRLSQGDVAGAAGILQSAIDADPGNVHALVLLGVLRERSGDAAAAEHILQKALSSDTLPDPQRAEVLMHLGRVLNRLQKHDDALAALREAARIQPDSVRPLRSLADALHGTQRAREALEYYEKALALDPSDWRTLNNLALALLTLERPADAEQRLRAAVNAAPSEATCLNNLGEALLRQFRASDAVEVYDRAGLMEPGNPMTLLGQARALSAAGKLSRATAAASKLPSGLPFPGAEISFVTWQLQRFAACDWGEYEAPPTPLDIRARGAGRRAKAEGGAATCPACQSAPRCRPDRPTRARSGARIARRRARTPACRCPTPPTAALQRIRQGP